MNFVYLQTIYFISASHNIYYLYNHRFILKHSNIVFIICERSIVSDVLAMKEHARRKRCSLDTTLMQGTFDIYALLSFIVAKFHVLYP